MKTKSFIRTDGMVLLLLLLFSFISLAALSRTAYSEAIGLKQHKSREAIIGKDKTIGFNLVRELSSHFNKEMGSILRIEYFFDTDPGYGNGIPLDFAPGNEITIDEAIPLNSLEEGIHIFYLRVCNEAGQWSQTLNRIFLKTQLQSDRPYNISRVEYFFDTDPGIGNGIATEYTLNNEILLENNWSVNSLNDGVHVLYVRAIDELGQSSHTFHRLFLKTHLGTDVVNIEEIEYFFDADPGNGNGTKIETSNGDRITVEQIIPVEQLSPGLHSINVRCKFSNNKWGQLYRRGFIKYPTYDVVKVEYYFDNDPGYGNATDLPINPSEMVIIDDVIQIQSLPSGNHTFNVRALSENDKWSNVFIATVTIFGGVGLDENENDRPFVSVYPNPTTGVLNLEINMIDVPIQIQLVSVSGTVLKNTTAMKDGDTTLDLSSFTSGMYILRFIYKEEVRTQNIILTQ